MKHDDETDHLMQDYHPMHQFNFPHEKLGREGLR